MSRSEIPIGLALIPCDCIIEDKKTCKKSLIGIFGNINVNALPCPMPSTSILVSMTGGTGEYLCEIICDAPPPGNEQVFAMKGKFVLIHPTNSRFRFSDQCRRTERTWNLLVESFD